MKTRKIALTEGVTAGILFGTAAIFIRFLGGLNVFSIAFWRLIIACIVLTIILLVNGELSSLRLMRNSLLRLSVLGVFLGFHLLLFVSAVKDTTILNATVLVNTAPIFSAILSTFLLKLRSYNDNGACSLSVCIKYLKSAKETQFEPISAMVTHHKTRKRPL